MKSESYAAYKLDLDGHALLVTVLDEADIHQKKDNEKEALRLALQRSALAHGFLEIVCLIWSADDEWHYVGPYPFRLFFTSSFEATVLKGAVCVELLQ